MTRNTLISWARPCVSWHRHTCITCRLREARSTSGGGFTSCARSLVEACGPRACNRLPPNLNAGQGGLLTAKVLFEPAYFSGMLGEPEVPLDLGLLIRQAISAQVEVNARFPLPSYLLLIF